MEHLDTNAQFAKYQRVALVVGLLGAAATAYGYVASRETFFTSYLMAFIYWFGPAAGGLGWLMIHQLVAGRWGFAIQRPLEAAAKTMPLMALLFVPIIFGMHDLYEWTHPEAVHDHITSQKLLYLNKTGFLIRAAIFFTIWSTLAYTLSAWSNRQDKDPNPGRINDRIRTLCGPGIVMFVLCISLASVDWTMSLTPHWFSTMFPPLFMVGHGLTTLAFMGIVASRMARNKDLHHVLTHQQFHDIGNLTFAFTILWTYMSLGEYIIIWSGNVYETTQWFLARAKGGWIYVAATLFICQFLIPFFLLLNKPLKRHGHIFAKIAMWIMAFRYLGIFWVVAPTFRHTVQFAWTDLAAWLGLGGIWLFTFFALLRSKPLLPSGDPRYKRATGAAHGIGHLEHSTSHEF